MEKVNCINCGAQNVTSSKFCIQCGHALPRIEAPVVESAPVQEDNFTAKFNKNKALIGTFFGLALFVLMIFAFKHFVFNPSILDKFKNSAYDKVLTTMANEMNKTCPVNVDQYTRLDNVLALPDKVLQYNFTLLGITKSDVNMDQIKDNVEPGILNNIKDNPQMETLRKLKATFEYDYHDKDGGLLFKIAVTPEMYE